VLQDQFTRKNWFPRFPVHPETRHSGFLEYVLLRAIVTILQELVPLS
jgi:hypothetical protein